MRFVLLSATVLFSLCVVFSNAFAADVEYLDVRGSVFQLAVDDIDGDGADELVYATYDGWVRCADAETGRNERWAHRFDSFPTALLVRASGPAAAPRIFLTDVDGRLTALSSDGRECWRWEAGLALHGVAWVRLGAGRTALATGGLSKPLVLLEPESGAEIGRLDMESFVQRLAAGDLDGDGVDEIAVADHREHLVLCRWKERRLERVSRAPLFLGEEFKNWESPGGTLKVFSLALADLDGDGRAEIIAGDSYFNPQAVLVLDGAGRRRWMHATKGAGHERFPGVFYSTAFVFPLPRGVQNAPVLAVLSGSQLRLFASDGRLVVDAWAEVGFTSLAVRKGSLYLGSSPNGDRTVYRVKLDEKVGERFASIRRHGLAATMGDSLRRIGEQARKRTTSGAVPGGSPHWWLVPSSDREAKDPGASYRRLLQWLVAEYPGLPVIPYVQPNAMEAPMPTRSDGKPWNKGRWNLDTGSGRKTKSVDALVALARRYDEARVPFAFYTGHSCTPWVTVDTARRLIEAAPRTLRGFYTAEDEGRDVIQDFITQWHAPVSDLLLAAPTGLVERFNVTKNKNVWWLASPAWPEVGEGLFGAGRGRVLMPTTEDSNSRTPELNLYARFGLYQAGLVKRIFASYVEDMNSFNRLHEWEYPLHGHLILRMLVAHTLLGAREFAVRGSGNLQWKSGEPGFGPLGRESTAVYLALLSKGLVFTPRPDQMLNVSPIGIRMHPASEAWLRDGFNGHSPHKPELAPELAEAVLPRNASTWGMTRTPPHALTAVLFGKRRQFGMHVPATPFGQVVFLPAAAKVERVPGVDAWWETDGVWLWKRGAEKVRLKGEAAAAALRESAVEAAGRLPFGLSGDPVFFQAVRLDGGGCRLWCIDPGWWDPDDRCVRISVRAKGVSALRDALTGERIPVVGGAVQLTVPAGALRILDAVAD